MTFGSRACKRAATVCVAVMAGGLVVAPVAARAHVRDLDPACAGITALESVTYEVKPRRGTGGDSYIATLRNDGLCTYEYGNAFSIAIREDGEWSSLPVGRHCAFSGEAYYLRPTQTASQRVGWLGDWCRYRTLRPGLYRVSKRIRSEEHPLFPSRDMVLNARFRVKD